MDCNNEIFEELTAHALTQVSNFGYYHNYGRRTSYAATKLGYESLKMEQKEAVKAFVEGNDVFVSLSTGFGKSLFFALLPVY